MKAVTALDNCTLEEALSGGHDKEESNFLTAARLTEDGDVLRIPPESFDIVSHPLECGHNIEHAGHSRRAVCIPHKWTEMKKAEDSEPVVEGDDDNVAVARKRRTVVQRT
jgi:hypothetical protein